MKISIVIPTLNEEEFIGSLLQDLPKKALPENMLEILVVDAHSQDRTVEMAEANGARVILTHKRGRAAQLALGGQHAQGDVLYFLHADTFPPKHFDRFILESVRLGYLAGCFGISFQPSSAFLRFFEKFVRLPWMICRGGDQSLFVTRNLYTAIGGYDARLKIMEDIEIIRRIRKNSSFRILSQKVISSSRKYQDHGAWKLQLLYTWIHLQYWVGISTNRIYMNSKKMVQKN